MAPPKIEQRTVTVPLSYQQNRFFQPVSSQTLTTRQDSYRSSAGEDGQSHWRPRLNGQAAPPASPEWLQTASAMEGYVRSGESARDMAEFALGEVEGAGHTLKATVQGTARLLRHPIQSADRLGSAVMSSGPALADFAKRSDDIMAEAIERKGAQFFNASNRERGRMTGAGLTNVALTLAPMPKMTAVVSSGWNRLVRALPKKELAESLGALPGKLSRSAGGAPSRETTGYLGRSGSDMVNFHGTNPPQNIKTTIKGLDYSGHSLDQMRNRGIMPSVVENTILHGSVSKGHSGNLVFSENSNNMRVIMDSKLDTVVTAVRGVRKSGGK